MQKNWRMKNWAMGIVIAGLLVGCFFKNNFFPKAPTLDIIEEQREVQKLIERIPVDALSAMLLKDIGSAYVAEYDDKKFLFVPADAKREKLSNGLSEYTLVIAGPDEWKSLSRKAHPEVSKSPAAIKGNENISQIIKNDVQVKELITSTEPNNLARFLLTDEEKGNFIVVYVDDSRQLMFVEEPALPIAIQRLPRYKKDYKCDTNVTMVAVAQKEDWEALAGKLREQEESIENNKEGVRSTVNAQGMLSKNSATDSIDQFVLIENSVGILKEKLLGALNNIPIENDGKDAGVNMAARAINIVDHMNKDDYLRIFKPNAPSSFGEKFRKLGSKTVTGTRIVALGLAVGAVFAAPVTAGASLAVPIAFLAPALVGDLLPADLGISPRQLAGYTTGYLKGKGSAEYESYSEFEQCARDIRADLQKGKPVIAFWTHTSKSAQYVIVVGATNSSKEFIVMQSNGFLYRLSKGEMDTLMKRQFWSYVGVVTTHKNYHLVRFKDVKNAAAKKKSFSISSVISSVTGRKSSS